MKLIVAFVALVALLAVCAVPATAKPTQTESADGFVCDGSLRLVADSLLDLF